MSVISVTVEDEYAKNDGLKKEDVMALKDWMDKQPHLPKITVEKEYEKNKELKKEDVLALKEWNIKQPHLPQLNELDLILFLHSCYFSNEAAKTTIDNFYTSRALCPEFFANRDPRSDKFKNVYTLMFSILPKPSVNNERIILGRLMNTDPDYYTLPNQVKSFDMVAMLGLHTHGTASGLVVISDFTGVSFGHIAKLGLVHLKKFFFYFQEAMPVRIKGIHFINSPSFIDKVMNLIRPFMKKELMAVLHIHTSDLTTLYPFVPKECLPKDYGGEAPSIEELFENQKKLFMDNVDYFLEEEKMLADESKRPGKPKNENDVFGVEGTFKKLDID